MAGLLAANFWVFDYSKDRPAAVALAVNALVAAAVGAAWRWPRASGVAMGIAAPFIAGLTLWLIVIIRHWMAR